jgi:hypothetical protein
MLVACSMSCEVRSEMGERQRCPRVKRGQSHILTESSLFRYSADGGEAPHVHVERERSNAKFWIHPVVLARSHGFARSELLDIHRIVPENEQKFRKRRMTTLVIDESSLRAVGAQLTDDALVVDLVDGRSVSVPLVWYPRLLRASVKERQQFRLIASGEGIHWELLDEDVSVEGIVAGRRSMESAESFQRWLEDRRERGVVEQ